MNLPVHWMNAVWVGLTFTPAGHLLSENRSPNGTVRVALQQVTSNYLKGFEEDANN